MKSLKSNVISNQFKDLIEAILRNDSPEKFEHLFTKRLYRYLTEYCGFGHHKNKKKFFDKYFKDFVAERGLFSQIFLAEGMSGAESHTMEWRSKNLEFHEKIRENIRPYESTLLKFLENKIEQYQICLAEMLLNKSGWKVDLSAKEIVAMGDYTEAILVAEALLVKHGFNLDIKSCAAWVCED
jgi:hypothetical protein